MAVDPDVLVEIAVGAAHAAAEVLLAAAGTRLRVDTKTSATDPVTAADRKSEEALVRTLLRARPDDGLLGEEGAARTSLTGLRWVVDPLDGTVNYLYGHPGWSVSIACEAEAPTAPGGWDAVIGVVFDPVRNEIFSGARGHGAWLQASGRTSPRTPLRVNDPVALQHALVATGFGYDRDHRTWQGRVALRVLEAARDLRRVGSAALDLCSVAAGRVDAYYEDSTKRWDVAAGRLIAREAGTVVTPLAGALPGTEGVVAAGPALHPFLARLVDPGRTPS